MGKKVSLKSSLDVQTIAIFGNKDSTEIDAIQPNQYTISWDMYSSLDDGINLRGNHSTSYKDKTTWTDIEYGNSQEISLDYNNFTTTIFKNDIGDLNTDGLELSYGSKDFKVFASHLNSCLLYTSPSPRD